MTDTAPWPSDLAALFTAETRLYALAGAASDLLVERWQRVEALSELSTTHIVAVAPDSTRSLDALIGQRLDLVTTLADGSQAVRSGTIRNAALLSSDGGLARYGLTVVPWLWYTTLGRHNRVFQHKSVLEIVEQVFADYAAIAAWHLADDLGDFLADVAPRPYCAQYRETDYAFVTRLLAEQGIGFTFVQDPDAPGGHSLYLFVDSGQLPEDVTSHSPVGGTGIRFHRASSQEAQDAIQQFGGVRELPYAAISATSYAYDRKANISAHTPTAAAYACDGAPALESYDYPGADTFASHAEAERYSRLAMQAAEARHKTWHGRSTVRTLAAGTTFTLTEANLGALTQLTNTAQDQQDQHNQFTLLSVTHTGINNLPSALAKRIEARLGGSAAVLEADAPLLARQTGYANQFTAIRRDVPWRPVLADDTGVRLNPRPTVHGHHTATVVGPDGATTPHGSDVLYTDALGRIKVRFHWQQGETPDDRLTCWLRVAQPSAGAGQGSQFIPRIGQEVMVVFLAGDIDRPVVTHALYNGQGEAGTPATPGGRQRSADTQAFEQASDHQPSAQANVAGGHAPAWHGAAPDSQRNAAALAGFKSQEFGGRGANQLVFDDTDHQQRIQLATTQAASQLNLGHLIHQADNYRGSFRGTGFELRTDAYGAVRGQRGLLATTYGANEADPAGDNVAATALLKQADQLAGRYNAMAQAHETTPLAGHIGAAQPHQAAIDSQRSPLAALLETARGQVTGNHWADATTDAQAKQTTPHPKRVPHSDDPILAMAAKAGIGMVAGQAIHQHADETLTLAGGGHGNEAIGQRMHIHSGQSIGLLAGVQGAADGLKLMAGQGDVDVQAQSDTMDVQAKDNLTVNSNAEAEFAAKTKVHIANGQGASITLEGGQIMVACPGKLTIQAGNKVFEGPGRMNTSMDAFPSQGGLYDETFELVDPLGRRMTDIPYVAEVDNQSQHARTDTDGRTRRFYSGGQRPARATYTLPNIKIGSDRFE